MIIKIQIQTPDGQAKGALKQFKWYFKLFSGCKINAYCNDQDNDIVLECDGTPRQIIQVGKNVASFHSLPALLFENKQVKGLLKCKFPEATGADFDKLKEMFDNGTKITIIKEASAQELIENNKTWWQKIKESFKKVEE
jgi:hypothetical protein